MTLREWALVAFTLLMQASVGVLLVVSAFHPLVSRGTTHAPVRPFDVPLVVAVAAAALALLVSLAHLGQPRHAWLAIANVRTSWLSREIGGALIFTAAMGSLAAVSRGESSPPAMRLILSVLAIALGLATVYAMSRLYMVPAQPAWNRIATPLGFLATTLVLGALVVLATAGVPGIQATRYFQPLAIAAVVVLAVQLALLPVQVAALAVEPSAAISAASAGHVAAWLAAGRAVLALAAAVLLVAMLRNAPGVQPATTASLALILVSASEVLGRLLFYASSVRL